MCGQANSSLLEMQPPVVHTCDPSPWEAKTVGVWVWPASAAYRKPVSTQQQQQANKNSDKEKIVSYTVVPADKPSPRRTEAEGSGILGQPLPRVKNPWAV